MGASQALVAISQFCEKDRQTPGGKTANVNLALLDFKTRDGIAVERTLTLDESYLVDQLSLEGANVVDGVLQEGGVQFGRFPQRQRRTKAGFCLLE